MDDTERAIAKVKNDLIKYTKELCDEVKELRAENAKLHDQVNALRRETLVLRKKAIELNTRTFVNMVHVILMIGVVAFAVLYPAKVSAFTTGVAEDFTELVQRVHRVTQPHLDKVAKIIESVDIVDKVDKMRSVVLAALAWFATIVPVADAVEFAKRLIENVRELRTK